MTQHTGRPYGDDYHRFETRGTAVQEYASGMRRDTEDGKTNYALMFDGPMLNRFAELLTRGAVKYGARNWLNARTEEDLERYRRSAARHFCQWMAGDSTEDHAAAIWFNVNCYEYVRARLDASTDAGCAR